MHIILFTHSAIPSSKTMSSAFTCSCACPCPPWLGHQHLTPACLHGLPHWQLTDSIHLHMHCMHTASLLQEVAGAARLQLHISSTHNAALWLRLFEYFVVLGRTERVACVSAYGAYKITPAMLRQTPRDKLCLTCTGPGASCAYTQQDNSTI